MSAQIDSSDMNATAQRIFNWSGPVMVAVFFIGWFMSGLLPPPSPALPAAEIVAKFAVHQTQTRIGCLLMIAGVALYGTWTAIVSVCVFRTESGRFPLFGMASAILCGCGTCIFGLIPLTWAVASFRGGAINPDVTQTLNDWAFFMVLYSWPTFFLWDLVIAYAIFRDRHPNPVFPRWLGYANVYMALALLPAGWIAFSKTGPFAYDGIISFWVVVIDFFAWMILMVFGTARSITNAERRAKEDSRHGEPAVPVTA